MFRDIIDAVQRKSQLLNGIQHCYLLYNRNVDREPDGVKNWSREEEDSAEQAHFSSHELYRSVRDHCGIDLLRTQLQQALESSAKEMLPSFKNTVEQIMKDAIEQLRGLPPMIDEDRKSQVLGDMLKLIPRQYGLICICISILLSLS